MKRLIYFLLTLLGFGAASCESQRLVEYGAPHADYKVSARVVDSEGNPIEGIEVRGSNNRLFGESDAEGNVSFKYRDTYLDRIIFRDVDGPENGGEFVDVELTRQDFDNKWEKVEEGEGWYQGVYELELGDVEMTLKSEESADE